MEINLTRDEVTDAVLLHIFQNTGMRLRKEEVKITFSEYGSVTVEKEDRLKGATERLGYEK